VMALKEFNSVFFTFKPRHTFLILYLYTVREMRMRK
jgi:hypothetical protein